MSAIAAARSESVSPAPPNQWTSAAVGSGGTPTSNQAALGLFARTAFGTGDTEA